jgi:hypothetical protein
MPRHCGHSVPVVSLRSTTGYHLCSLREPAPSQRTSQRTSQRHTNNAPSRDNPAIHNINTAEVAPNGTGEISHSGQGPEQLVPPSDAGGISGCSRRLSASDTAGTRPKKHAGTPA